MGHARDRLPDGRQPFAFYQLSLQPFDFTQILKKADNACSYIILKKGGSRYAYRDLVAIFCYQAILIIDKSVFPSIGFAVNCLLDCSSHTRGVYCIHRHFANNCICCVAQQMLGALIESNNGPFFIRSYNPVNRTLDEVFLKVMGLS